jgi:hypothetical protein
MHIILNINKAEALPSSSTVGYLNSGVWLGKVLNAGSPQSPEASGNDMFVAQVLFSATRPNSFCKDRKYTQ